MPRPVSNVFVSPDSSLQDCIRVIDRGGKAIAVVVDGQDRLLGTVTDGDVRRAILAGIGLEKAVRELLDRKAGSRYPKPLTASVGTGRGELLRIMREAVIHQLPIIDEDGRVVDLVTLDDLMPEQARPMQAVVMAGGLGMRLRPLTEDVPKTMLPLGDRPLMERIIGQLRDAGIRRVNVSTYYKPEQIQNHFGDGSGFGVHIEYVCEDRPLGTAGALGLMDEFDQPLLVINSDIVTRVDFRAMHAFHREHAADLTVAVGQYDLQVPYGVIECEGEKVRQVQEKPLLKFFVNAGIYLLEPSVHQFVPPGERLDMTDLIGRLIQEGRSVVAFPIVEYWLDVGRPDDYERAQADLREGKLDR